MNHIKILFAQLLFLILFFPSIFLAQAPESMNYQAVIRDGSGDLVATQQVGLRIKILQGSATGSSVYEETYSPTTNAYGLVNLQLGTGTVQSGTFSSIDWGNGPYFVETAADVSGGTSYVTLSTTQFMSVPYALYAKNAGLDSAAVQAMIDAGGGSTEHYIDYTNLSGGDWITIAQVGDGTNNRYRADGLFMLQDRNSGYHQTIIFRAGLKFNKTYLKLESSNKYNLTRFSDLRIAYGGTYDGAVLQVKLNMTYSPSYGGYLRVYQNTNTDGWVINSGVLSAANTPVVYASSNNSSNTGQPYANFKTLELNYTNSNRGLEATAQDVLINGGNVRITNLATGAGNPTEFVIADEDGDLSTVSSASIGSGGSSGGGLDSAAVQAMIDAAVGSGGGGSGGGGKSLFFPEGIHGEGVNLDFRSSGASYTVPANKRLYIISSGSCDANGETIYFSNNTNKLYSYAILNPNTIITNSHEDFIYGLLVDVNPEVTVFMNEFIGNNTYTVPTGKKLYLTQTSSIWQNMWTSTYIKSKLLPIILNEGDSFYGYANNGEFSGYLVDDDFFESSSSGSGGSSSSNSGSNANTLIYTSDGF